MNYEAQMNQCSSSQSQKRARFPVRISDTIGKLGRISFACICGTLLLEILVSIVLNLMSVRPSMKWRKRLYLNNALQLNYS